MRSSPIPSSRGLTSGDLDRSAFEFYTVQDALYLKDYARALSLAAVKAPDEDTIILFNEHAKGCLVEERAMQENFFDVFGLSSEQVWATPKAPVCQAYTSYLLSVAYGRPFHEVVAVVLPCYWIYWEVGKLHWPRRVRPIPCTSSGSTPTPASSSPSASSPSSRSRTGSRDGLPD